MKPDLLIELDYYQGSEKTLYLTDGPGRFDPYGTFYYPAVAQAAYFNTEMDLSQFGGRASVSYGETTIANGDGHFNFLNGAWFEGRQMRMYALAPGLPFNQRELVLRATMESAEFRPDVLAIQLTSQIKRLDKPLQPNKYGGTNVLPNGYDGTADDIKGQYIPRIYGRVSLMWSVRVNTAHEIHQVNDRGVAAVLNVFDGAAYFDRGSDYASQAALEASAPGPGDFRAWPAGGYYRLERAPFRAASACVVERWEPDQISAAGVSRRILEDMAFTSAGYALQDFTTLDAKNAGPVGVLVEGGETAASVLERVAASVGAWIWFDELDVFRIVRLDAPIGNAALSLDDTVIDTCIKRPQPFKPAWKVSLDGDTNYAVQEANSLAGIVTENYPARAAWFGAEVRSASASDPTTRYIRLDSDEYTSSSVQVSLSQLQAETVRRLGLLKNRLDILDVALKDVDVVAWLKQLKFGMEVLLKTHWYGYDAGRPMIVAGIRRNIQRNQLGLVLLG